MKYVSQNHRNTESRIFACPAHKVIKSASITSSPLFSIGKYGLQNQRNTYHRIKEIHIAELLNGKYICLSRPQSHQESRLHPSLVLHSSPEHYVGWILYWRIDKFYRGVLAHLLVIHSIKLHCIALICSAFFIVLNQNAWQWGDVSITRADDTSHFFPPTHFYSY